MAKRVTHARAEEILSKVSSDEAYEIGQAGPTAFSKGAQQKLKFISLCGEKGVEEPEAEELWRYLSYGM